MPISRVPSTTSSEPMFFCCIRTAASCTDAVRAAVTSVCAATMERIERIGIGHLRVKGRDDH